MLQGVTRRTDCQAGNMVRRTPVEHSAPHKVTTSPFPSFIQLLADKVWEYCEHPKTLQRIASKFDDWGDLNVRNALSLLEAQGRMRREYRGKHKTYRSLDTI